jgi:hypothetical protein
MDYRRMPPFHHCKPPTANWKLHTNSVAALVCLGLLALAGRVSAQPAAGSRAPVFKYYVWGQVHAPGAYSLGGNPDLLELLSAAGGPTEYADVRHVVLVRATTQKQIRVDLKKMLAAAQVVSLSPGDVVMVPDSPWYSIRYALEVATAVASFATLAMTIVIYAGGGK